MVLYRQPAVTRRSLQSFPNEILCMILEEISSVHDMVNFVKTCRKGYGNFQAGKRHFLQVLLRNALGAAVIRDALFLAWHYHGRAPAYEHDDSLYEGDYRAKSSDYIAQVTTEYLTLRGLVNNHSSGDDPLWRLGMSTSDFNWPTVEPQVLCKDLRSLEFLADLYVKTRLRSFSHPKAAPAACAEPTRTERQRVLRAFYRRQILSNVWAPEKRPEYLGDQCMVIDDYELLAIGNTVIPDCFNPTPPGLLAAFSDWEMEQIDQANLFITRLSSALCTAAANRTYAIPEGHLAGMVSQAPVLIKYMRNHPLIAKDAIDKMSTMPQCTNTAPFDTIHPYLKTIHKYSIPFFTPQWQARRRLFCFDTQRHEGYKCAFLGDAVELPPFGWVDAVDGWFDNPVGRRFREPEWQVNRNPDVDDAYKDVAERFWPFEYIVAVFRVGGFAMWDRKRVEAIKVLPQLGGWGRKGLETGWAKYEREGDIWREDDSDDQDSDDQDSDDQVPDGQVCDDYDSDNHDGQDSDD
ncbi:hypothetical protein B0T21DRAFT_415955 [Apiosordaria backusii]|uniref:F-box domain-containing protein n=1 Tax=Apiosordaria backusii TaxID=314023 RepID=A0AA40A705_9PEZI|nr:hypothetical protein B0T21DRAFT_415955 [Apiosordaria backusii]